MKGTPVKNIVDSTKKFVKNHQVEIAAAAVAVVGVVVGAKIVGHQNCINITKGMKKAMSTGGMIVVDHHGTEYAMALYQYLPVDK